MNKIKKIDFINFFKSFYFFIISIFLKNNYDVIFLTHRHFNRGKNGENLFFKPFLEYCEKNKLKYLIYEENSLDGKFDMFPRNTKAVPLDFISLLQRILRILYSKNTVDYKIYKNFYDREKKISNILKIFLKNNCSKRFILLAHNNVELIRYCFPHSDIYDYQHGIIWNGHENILENSKASDIKVLNNIKTLLYGESFKNLMIKYDDLNYYSNDNLINIGYYHSIEKIKDKNNNKNILYTLQNVDMHSYEDYYKSIINLLLESKEYLENNNYKIFIKNHPRYDREQKINIPKELRFVTIIDDNKNINSLINTISIHITSKSTTAFDMALNSIPTIFTNLIELRSPIEMFKLQYNYPLDNLIINNSNDFVDALKFLEKDTNYLNVYTKVYDWANNFYQKFDKNILENILEKKQK